MLDIQKVQATQ